MRRAFLVLALSLAGCESGPYRVQLLDEYCQHLAGVDLKKKHGAPRLIFDCEALAEQSAKAAEELMKKGAQGASRPGTISAKRMGGILRLENDVTLTEADFDGWARQLGGLAKFDPTDLKKSCGPAAIRRLFDEIELHVGRKAAAIPVAIDPGLKCR